VKQTTQRFWELDVLRGSAVVLMLVFHFLFDVTFFGFYDLDLSSGFFLVYVYTGASLFLGLVGVSLILSFERVQHQKTTQQLLKKFGVRGVLLFGGGLLITLGTWLYLEEGFIVFGALHCIGLSILLAYPFLRFRYGNLVLGIVLIGVGIYLRTITMESPWLLWLGVRPSGLYTVDYFPLLPWFGVVLVGMFFGKTLYYDYKRTFALRDVSQWKIFQALGFLGRHSLVIYLVHQPVLIGVFHLAIIIFK